MMQLDSVTLDGKQLALVASEFGAVRPDFQKTVTINFTGGKANDPRWTTKRPKTQGLTKPSDLVVNEVTRTCSGSLLIDVEEILRASWNPAQTVGRQRLAAGLSSTQFHYLCVVCVVHELVHVHQGWRIGDQFARAMLNEKIRADAVAKSNLEKDPELPGDGYLLNKFEQGARDFVERWKDANGDAVHAGKFDFLLPIATLRGLFPDKDKPF